MDDFKVRSNLLQKIRNLLRRVWRQPDAPGDPFADKLVPV